MSMSIGAGDAANMVFKSQMTGVSHNLQAPQAIKEADRGRETERTRDADPDAAAEDAEGAGSSSGATRAETRPRVGSGQDRYRLHRLGRGQADWGDMEHGQGWLPPTLRPQARTAGTSNPFNVPYWLMQKDEKTGSDNPLAAHRKLLNGLRTMVNVDIQQYIKSNEPPYAKKTLRDIYNVLNDGQAPTGAPPNRESALTGDPTGLNVVNWRRAHATYNLLEFPQPQLGEAFEEVA